MHNIQVDRILTEARGLCWHDWNYLEDGRKWICVDCLEVHEVQTEEPDNPSPTTNWQDYGEVIEWAKKKDNRGFWLDFSNWMFDESALVTTYRRSEYLNIVTDPETGSRALAEFIESEGL